MDLTVFMESATTASQMILYAPTITVRLKALLYSTWTSSSESTSHLGEDPIIPRKWTGKKIIIFVSKYKLY